MAVKIIKDFYSVRLSNFRICNNNNNSNKLYLLRIQKPDLAEANLPQGPQD